MKTSYFTFGQSHVHSLNGFTFDKDIIVKINAKDPRNEMVYYFGDRWAMEYSLPPDLTHFPRGIIDLKGTVIAMPKEDKE